ncbi:MAG TPA: DUF454 domain-containing protein [Tissierellia bacterium]|nr:DUF454 domain-containing protein [Tissierellia bacterium]
MKKTLYIIGGFISLGLGVIGIVLPILPTVPFFLLTSWLFYRSSEKNYRWLMEHPLFGPRLRQYDRYKAIPKGTKHYGIIVLWLSLLLSIWLVKKPIVGLILPIIGLLVTRHILSIRTLTKQEQAEWRESERQRINP